MSRNQQANESFALTSFLYGGNADYIEDLYARYETDPRSVPDDWQRFFEEMKDDKQIVLKNAMGPSWERQGWPIAANGELVAALDGNWGEVGARVEEKVRKKAQSSGVEVSEADVMRATRDSVRALMLIRAYRVRGHLHAKLDPLGIAKPADEDYNELSPSAYGFTEADYDRKIYIDHVLGLEFATIREMVDILRRTYCTTLGVEFMHISNPHEKAWLQERIEGPDKGIFFTDQGKRAILNKLIESEGFEKFCDVRFKGTKRFGLDGSEALIPALEQIIKRGGQMGLKEIVFGMAHRGRLNVLSQVMGKPHRAIFHEFQGGSAQPDDWEGSGDVKYHLGASSDRAFDDNTVHLSLAANPSHLEIVDPVVLGKARAKQDQIVGPTRGEIVPLSVRKDVMPLLIHGDAAFAGQGVVAECLNLSGLRGHRVAGTVHFIINNQIGFTTYPRFSRSSPYPSDTAKMVEAPIFHVNGDDPEAVVYAAKVATEFRMLFHKPVVVDMFCYRRYGHNEGDEPGFTQPIMYRKIREHPSTLEIYSKKLIEEGIVTAEQVESRKSEWRQALDQEFEAAQSYRPNRSDWLDGAWTGLRQPKGGEEHRHGITGVDLETLKSIGKKLTAVPEGFAVHKTIQRFLDNRTQMVETGQGIDWATAEAMAFGSLALEGHPIRFSGQDSERGTFSQRHSVLYDQNTEERYIPLANLAEGQAVYEVINSALSEEAVLGFEYGYSLSLPNGLTIWEAQFGDFANGAQVVIDQFISSAETKWMRMSGLVMLLPHGYEGQGPEHSSARLERYLQLCAQDNMQVANCTTPANYFHVLRRQLKRDFRKPLILMTPKSLLRHKRAVSDLSEMAGETHFKRWIRDDAETKDTPIKLVADDKIRRVVLCTGKVYYDLYEAREERGIDDIYLLRVEQLYPFPARSLMHSLSRFPNAEMVWCQEEPKNMGAWTFIEPYLEWVLERLEGASRRARYAGRHASASPAAGTMSKHLAELKAFVEDALGA
ncbi:2-oxoglutarate dehydrogenase E1 component [Consotaella salsifontis]|uniref:2-oxoglutarate dehydrogenase E1 component n=1 Tax=Consotaella salsifontis TaxID=1365950 RepID=A0A1T4T568_9HYPH|nr:2-oxoglutarate dehydrogenase E1 component [Consotaella salsifontis]SKA35592.1 2-oxoglutarate dehydrogenase E1 component [Consotaella salsifontis]